MAITQIVDHCCQPAAVHDHLGQLETRRRVTLRPAADDCAHKSVCARIMSYLWCVFHHLPHQSCDVLPHVLIRIPEAGHCCREDLSLHHHLRQADRVLTDLTQSGEHLPLDGDRNTLNLFSCSQLNYCFMLQDIYCAGFFF